MVTVLHLRTVALGQAAPVPLNLVAHVSEQIRVRGCVPFVVVWGRGPPAPIVVRLWRGYGDVPTCDLMAVVDVRTEQLGSFCGLSLFLPHPL